MNTPSEAPLPTTSPENSPENNFALDGPSVRIENIISDEEFAAIEAQEKRIDTTQKALSESRKRQNARKKKIGPRVNEFTLDGPDDESEDWYILRLNTTEVMMIGFLTHRDGDGKINLGIEESLGSFMAAVLYVCCAKNKGDENSFFANIGEAQEWVDDPACDDAVTALFNMAIIINPKLMLGVVRPKVKTVGPEMMSGNRWEKLMTTLSETTSPTSETPTTSPTPPTGSPTEAVPSTDKPATLQPAETN